MVESKTDDKEDNANPKGFIKSFEGLIGFSVAFLLSHDGWFPFDIDNISYNAVLV